MTPAEFLALVRARGVKIRDQIGKLVLRPLSLLTDSERDYASTNAEPIVALLRQEAADQDALSLDLDLSLALDQAQQAEQRSLHAAMPHPPPVVLYRTATGGMLPLSHLSIIDVQRLRKRHALTDDQLRQWLARNSAPDSSPFIF